MTTAASSEPLTNTMTGNFSFADLLERLDTVDSHRGDLQPGKFFSVSKSQKEENIDHNRYYNIIPCEYDPLIKCGTC